MTATTEFLEVFRDRGAAIADACTRCGDCFRACPMTQPAGLSAYAASKAALNACVLTLAHEFAPRRITANALLPTALATAPMRAQMPGNQLVPLDRVAEWIAFLLSDNGAGVTGQLIKLEA